MPDASGRFKGIVVPCVPWLEDPDEKVAYVDLDPDQTDEERERFGPMRVAMARNGRLVELSVAPPMETR